jgi:hypothetical protein
MDYTTRVPIAEPTPPGGLSQKRLVEGVLWLAVFVTAATMPMQNDSWWHLRTGQEIWTTVTLPRHDLYSFVIPASYPWHNHEWLAQVLMYGGYVWGGLPLLTLLSAALASLALVPTHALSPGKPLHRAALVFLAVPLIRVGWSVRPQIFTLFFFGLTLWLLVRERELLLPPIFLLWANLHGGVALGGLLLVGSVLSTLFFEPEGPGRRDRLRRRILGTALCGAATLCTPLGLNILLFPLEGTRRSKASGNIEFQSPDLHSVGGVCFWMATALFVYLLLTRQRRLRTAEDRLLGVLATLFLPLAVTSMRTVPHFLLLAVPVMARLAPLSPHSGTGDGDDGPGPRPARKNLLIFSLCAAPALGFLIFIMARPLGRMDWHPMSAAAVAAIRQAPPPTYNTYDDGGFLIWFTPERKVFVDSREYCYPDDLLLSALAVYRSGDYQALFARYGFRSAVIRPDDLVGRRLLQHGWTRTYADAKWQVLIAPP